MPRDHLALEQHVGGPGLAQTGNPLRRLHVEHPGVVQRGDREDPRIPDAVADVLVRAVRLHVGIDILVVKRVAPLVPLDHGQWQRRIEDRRQGVHERHAGEDPGEQLGREIRHGAHEQTAGAATLCHHPARSGHTRLDQMLAAGDEVGEGVALVEELPVLVPLPAHLAASAHMGDREDHTAVQLGKTRDRESGIDRVLVRSVAVEVHRARFRSRLPERALPDE